MPRQLEFQEIVFQSDLQDKLASLEALVARQPQASNGVSVAEATPADLMRGVRCTRYITDVTNRYNLTAPADLMRGVRY